MPTDPDAGHDARLVKGLDDRRAGRVRPWGDIKKELRLEEHHD
jgi:hypothetical protein